MSGGARRLLSRPCSAPARRARLATGLWLALLGAQVANAAEIVSARYAEPTTRYDHGVLGDAVEWGALDLKLNDGRILRHRLPKTRVFEDTGPRLADLDGDDRPEVIVVETHLRKGASLAVYGVGGKIVATPHIGQRNRWLAPVGAADLDGDGAIEIAFVDRPHLARILRIWRYDNGRLTHLADKPGVTNHRIGDATISGGVRDCGGAPELVLADAGFGHVTLATFTGGAVNLRGTRFPATAPGFDAVLSCSD